MVRVTCRAVFWAWSYDVFKEGVPLDVEYFAMVAAYLRIVSVEAAWLQERKKVHICFYRVQTCISTTQNITNVTSWWMIERMNKWQKDYMHRHKASGLVEVYKMLLLRNSKFSKTYFELFIWSTLNSEYATQSKWNTVVPCCCNNTLCPQWGTGS